MRGPYSLSSVGGEDACDTRWSIPRGSKSLRPPVRDHKLRLRRGCLIIGSCDPEFVLPKSADFLPKPAGLYHSNPDLWSTNHWIARELAIPLSLSLLFASGFHSCSARMASGLTPTSESWSPAPYGRACAQCSRAKSKCFYLSRGTDCER